MPTKLTFSTVLKECETDQNIVGFTLLGSRGKGFENEFSDYDVLMVVRDDVADTYKARYDGPKDGMDMPVQSLSEFRTYANWGSPEASGERYDFTHCNILIDRTGEIATLAQKKGRIPPEIQKSFVHESIDAYVNGVFRSVKAWRNKNPIGAQFEAAASIAYFLDALFGVYGRPKPYYGYINKEFQRYPLDNLPWDPTELIATLVQIFKTADLKTQQNLLK